MINSWNNVVTIICGNKFQKFSKRIYNVRRCCINELRKKSNVKWRSSNNTTSWSLCSEKIYENDAANMTHSLLSVIKYSLTFPHVKDIPLGLRTLKTSVTCLFKMDELPPHACSNLSPAPNIFMSLLITTPNGKRRKRNEIDTGANSRPSGVFILLFFAIWEYE